MKKLILIFAVFVFGALTVSAQNTVVIDTEKVFKSVQAYNDAMSSLEKLAEQYQQRIDNAYAEVEKMFNDYQNEKAYLSATTRDQREDAIIKREREIAGLQEELFGQQGQLIQKRVELIKPIQDRVFAVINDYAQRNNIIMVTDLATNPGMIYYSPSIDRTEEIIRLLR